MVPIRWALAFGAAITATQCRCDEPREPARLDAPTLTSPQLVAGGPMAQGEPVVAELTDGAIIVSFMDWSSGEPFVVWSVSRDGGKSFPPAQRVASVEANNPTRQADPTLAVTSSGEVFLSYLECWRDKLAPTGQRCLLKVQRSSDAGLSWSLSTVTTLGPRPDRPWLTSVGDRVFLSWTEEFQGAAPKWVLAEWQDSTFKSVLTVDATQSYAPPASASDRIHTILIPRTQTRSPNIRAEIRTILLRDTATTLEPGTRPFAIALSQVVIPLSLGAITADTHREPVLVSPLAELRGMHAVSSRNKPQQFPEMPLARTTMAAATRLQRPDNANAIAWLTETSPGLWSLRIRCVVDGALSPITELGPPFAFDLATPTNHIGDFLTVHPAQDGAFWIAWSATPAGSADVYLARGTCPLPHAR